MKILLAVDDSEFGKSAVRMLLSQNRPEATQVRVLNVVEPVNTITYMETPIAYGPRVDQLEKLRLEKARAFVEKVAKLIRARGFKVATEVRKGDSRSEIIQSASRWKANLIVLGSHSRKGVPRILLGSVSEFVARHAPCSVQIVRSPG